MEKAAQKSRISGNAAAYAALVKVNTAAFPCHCRVCRLSLSTLLPCCMLTRTAATPTHSQNSLAPWALAARPLTSTATSLPGRNSFERFPAVCLFAPGAEASGR